MSKLALRFRPRSKRLFLAIGLLLALAVTPLLQAANASSVIIDSTFSSRVYSGPGGATDFAGTTTVQHGNVVQYGILVHNAEDANSDRIAKNFKIKVTIPDASTGAQQISTETISADNGTSPGAYKATDTATLKSANGQPFTVTGLRNIQLQRNNVAKTNTPTFNWGTPENVPYERVEVSRQGNASVLTITPNANGDLGPCFHNALRIIFLADVTQGVPGPQLSIEKKVRQAPATNFSDANTARPNTKQQYFVELKNVGGSDATNVVLRDALPKNVSLIPGSVQIRSSSNPTLHPGPDNFVNGGISYATFGAGAWVQVYFNAQIGNITDCPWWFKNFALVKSDQTNGSEFYDSVRTDLVCTQVTPTPTPTSTPTATPSPTPTSTPTATPSPTPTSTPTATPTPGSTASPSTPPGPPTESGSLPKTGAAGMAGLSLIALSIAGYLYVRERRALRSALNSSRLK